MSKPKTFMLGFAIGGLLMTTLFFLNFCLNSNSQNKQNKHSDKHLTCSYSKNNSNVLICKINGAENV